MEEFNKNKGGREWRITGLLDFGPLIFVGMDISVVCGSRIGETGEKWCGLMCKRCVDVGPKVHQTGDKFEDLRLGLYVRVPSTNPDKVYVYTDPVIPVSKLTVESLQEFLNLDEDNPLRSGKKSLPLF